MIEFAAESHPGNRYQHNEDSLGWVEAAGVWLVADGMGGHAYGDVASRIVKQTLLRSSEAAQEQAKQHSQSRFEPPPLTEMISDAHAEVVAEGVRRSVETMGSTVAMVRVQGNKAEVGWCGDSRVYLWRDQQLIRLTRDHSLLEQLLESGVVEPVDAFGHPQKHVLVQALGIANSEPVPAQLSVDLANDDMLLLCSDGLHDELRDEQISDLLLGNPEPADAADALVARTLLGEARDNVSVVCVRVSDIETAQSVLSIAELRERFERRPLPQQALAAQTTLPPQKAATEMLLLASDFSADHNFTADVAAEGSEDPASEKEFDRVLVFTLAVVVLLIGLVVWVA